MALRLIALEDLNNAAKCNLDPAEKGNDPEAINTAKRDVEFDIDDVSIIFASSDKKCLLLDGNKETAVLTSLVTIAGISEKFFMFYLRLKMNGRVKEIMPCKIGMNLLCLEGINEDNSDTEICITCWISSEDSSSPATPSAISIAEIDAR